MEFNKAKDILKRRIRYLKEAEYHINRVMNESLYKEVVEELDAMETIYNYIDEIE